MERRAKERLIGACILVVLVVAVVPELLSGPKPAAPAAATAGGVHLPAGTATDPVRNVTVDLATAKPAVPDAADTPAAPQTPPGGSTGNAASGPVGAAAPGSTPAGTAPAAPSPTLQSPGAQWSAAPPPATASGGNAPGATASAGSTPAHSIETPAALPTSGQSFAVQLGSFANRGNADKLVHQLKAQGFTTYMSAEGSGSAARYRVRVGPLADRDAADRMIAKLKGLGHAATIVSPR